MCAQIVTDFDRPSNRVGTRCKGARSVDRPHGIDGDSGELFDTSVDLPRCIDGREGIDGAIPIYPLGGKGRYTCKRTQRSNRPIRRRPVDAHCLDKCTGSAFWAFPIQIGHAQRLARVACMPREPLRNMRSERSYTRGGL